MPGSYEKVDYTIRPSKQVERKLFIETFNRLRQVGYQLSSYSYVGFGSVYYVDFVLFHKYLLIDRMECVEQSDIPRRMRFNKPFKCVRLSMSAFSDIIPKLSRNRQYIVWLDYDYGPTAEVLRDIEGALQTLSQGSFLLVTIDAERRMGKGQKIPSGAGDQDLSLFLREELGHHLPANLRPIDLERKTLPRTLAGVLRSQIEESMLTRPELRFCQLFNFQYDDGAQMLTVGGIIETPERKRTLRSAGIFRLDHIETGATPLSISVPPLTARERQWLDRYLLGGKGKARIPFEIKRSHLRNYQQYYRHYPAFHESLL